MSNKNNRRRNRYPLYENVEIIDLALEGKAVGKVKNNGIEAGQLTIFVTKVVPGDIVDVQINKKKRNYKEGYPTTFIKYSSKRVEPKCEHFGTCGGCTRQLLSYKDQLIYKQNTVEQTLIRLAKTKIPNIQPIIGSNDEYFYRNKLEFSFSNKRWLTEDEKDNEHNEDDMNALGFHIPGKFDKILDIKKCWLQPEPSNSIRLEVKDFALKNKLTFYDIRQETGLLRNMIIRTTLTGQIMVICVFFNNEKENIHALLMHLKNKFPSITSLMYVINQKKNDTITDLNIKLFAGKDYIFETMENLKFKIGPKSFFQTNSKQAYNLYKVVRDFAELKGTETVYDLYTGTGTIACFLANNCKNIIGIENVPEAIEDAKINAKYNNILNTTFFAGDMKDVLNKDFITQNGQPDLIILDPPRAGIHKNVVSVILETAPNKIIYVSCNVATQARDIELLSEKYSVIKVQPADLFPHTHHIENVVLMVKNEQI